MQRWNVIAFIYLKDVRGNKLWHTTPFFIKGIASLHTHTHTHTPYTIHGGIIYENNVKHLFCFYIFRPQIIHNGSLDSGSNNNIVQTIIKKTLSESLINCVKLSSEFYR